MQMATAVGGLGPQKQQRGQQRLWPHGDWKPDIQGGVRRVSVPRLLMAWWLYHAKHIGPYDLRVYWACHELDERRDAAERCQASERLLQRDERYRQYRVAEVVGLVGGGGVADVRRSLRRLERVGLVRARKHEIRFAASPDELKVDDLDDLFEALSGVTNRRRVVPVPRRLLRELARGFSRSLTATILGHLIAGCYWHRKHEAYRTDGRCKASWVAETFGIAERSVHAARRELREGLGWLNEHACDQWMLNKWGMHFSIDVAWSRPEESERRGKSAGPRVTSRPISAPPVIKQVSPPTEESKHQYPARPGSHRAGAFTRKGGGRGRGSARRQPSRPTHKHVQRRDLEDPGRLRVLFTSYSEAGKLRAVGGKPAVDQLTFFAMAQRALEVGRNPAAVFATLVRDRRVNYVTNAQEDEANRRFKRHLYGDTHRRTPTVPEAIARTRTPSPYATISSDARVVAAVLSLAGRGKVPGDPFHALRRERPEWTRERWDAGHAELENARLEQARRSVSRGEAGWDEE